MNRGEKIFYAVGNESLESYLTSNGLREADKVVATVVHRGAIIPKLKELSLTSQETIILILNEGLPDVSEGTILEICKRIRIEYPHVRVLLLGGEHKVGDEFLTALLNMGVYDVVFGQKLNVNRVVEVMHNPMTYADALSFVQESNVSLTDIKEADKEPEIIETKIVSPAEQSTPKLLKKKKNNVTLNSSSDVFGSDLDLQNTEDVGKPTLSSDVKRFDISANDKPVEQDERGVNEKVQLETPDASPSDNQGVIPTLNPASHPKMSLIFGVSDSYSAREVGLSVANALANMDKKVLLVDITKGNPLLPPRLNVKIDRGIKYFTENMDVDVDLSDIPTSPYLNKNKNISPSLQILCYEDDEDMIDAEALGQMTELLKGYGYNHIIYMADQLNDYETIQILSRQSERVLVVADQYSVTVNRTYDVIRTNRLKPGLVLVDTIKKLHPRLNELKQLYGCNYGEELSTPRVAMLQADASMSPYMGMERRKIVRLASYLGGEGL